MAPNLVRNVFDPYRHRENRLTHALVHAIAHDKTLARQFVRFATGTVLPASYDLSVSCQAAPGDSLEQLTAEREPDDPSVPDAWIFDEEAAWALVCECKLTASLEEKQLRRHLQAAQRRGFDQVALLAITAHEEQPSCIGSLGQGHPEISVSWRNWAQVHSYFSRLSRDAFVLEFVDYMRVLEEQLMADGYDGPPLRSFEGIRFGASKPYTESAAKVLLRSLMKELRPKMQAILPVDTSVGRSSMGGAWDIIWLTPPSLDTSFTEHPHLTVWLGRDEAGIQVTLPNNAHSQYWARLRRSTKAAIHATLTAVNEELGSIRRSAGPGVEEPRLTWSMGQVHFHGRRTEVRDGEIFFDVESILAPEAKSASRVKNVPAWLDAAFALVQQKNRANFELSLQARFPYVPGGLCSSPHFVDTLTYSAKAFRPFSDLLLG